MQLSAVLIIDLVGAASGLYNEEIQRAYGPYKHGLVKIAIVQQCNAIAWWCETRRIQLMTQCRNSMAFEMSGVNVRRWEE